MKRYATIAVLSVLVCIPAFSDTSQERLSEAADVLKASLDAPDQGTPQDLLEKANCVVIVPGVKKAAFIFGAKYGKGFMVCRKANNNGWGSPAAVRMEGGSFGFQIGASETDVVMLVIADSNDVDQSFRSDGDQRGAKRREAFLV